MKKAYLTPDLEVLDLDLEQAILDQTFKPGGDDDKPLGPGEEYD